METTVSLCFLAGKAYSYLEEQAYKLLTKKGAMLYLVKLLVSSTMGPELWYLACLGGEQVHLMLWTQQLGLDSPSLTYNKALPNLHYATT